MSVRMQSDNTNNRHLTPQIGSVPSVKIGIKNKHDKFLIRKLQSKSLSRANDKMYHKKQHPKSHPRRRMKPTDNTE